MKYLIRRGICAIFVAVIGLTHFFKALKDPEKSLKQQGYYRIEDGVNRLI